MEIRSKTNFAGIFLFVVIWVVSILTSADEGKGTACNITVGRYKRNTPKTKYTGGVTVCITANPAGLNVHGSNKGKKHHHQGESSESSSSEHTTRRSDDDDNDSGSETIEEDLVGATGPIGQSGNNNHHHHSSAGGRVPSKSHNKNKSKGKLTRVILEEQFIFRNWSSEWIHAKNANESTTKLYNKFSRVYARKSNHSRPNYGLITNNKGGEFYMIATTFPPFNNRNETLVMQFSVQFQSRAFCQLAFLRLYDCQFSTEDFGVTTPYIMQVGPYICGTSRISRLSAEFQEPGKTTIRSVDKNIEPINNTSVSAYALVLEPDGTYHIIVNTNVTQNGSLRDVFQSYKGYTSICAVGLVVWHSVLDKYFKGQMIVDDVLITNDPVYAESQRNQILHLYSD